MSSRGSCSRSCRIPFLNVAPDRPRYDNLVEIRPGSTLVPDTDGLVETRRDDLDHGIARLRASLTRRRNRDLEDLLDNILITMTNNAADDDIAILAIRFHAQAAT